MAVYTVTLRADEAKYPILLSNGNLVDSGKLDNGGERVELRAGQFQAAVPAFVAFTVVDTIWSGKSSAR